MSIDPDLTEMQKCRRIPRGEKRREEIAAVAERVFLELGYTETTMQIVASRAGASKETLYRHFGSKEGLFSEVVRARSARVYGGPEGVLQLSGEPRDVLRRLLPVSGVEQLDGQEAPEADRVQGPHQGIARDLRKN